MLIKEKKSYLLLMIGLIAFIMYHMSSTEMSHIDKQATEYKGKVVSSDIGHDTAVAVPGGNIMRFFLDKDGNEIPVFDENTVYPKPGGGYCNMTPITDKEEYFQALENPTSQCKYKELYGGYQVCLDSFKKKNDCIVLSFGISDFKRGLEFEDLLVDRQGCQTYSFDPTMVETQMPIVRKNGKNKFFNLGLSSFKGLKTISFLTRRNLNCSVDRYINIVNMLGLADKEIDFLKLDIEGSELDFFLDTASDHPELLQNVRQIQLEFHNVEEFRYFHSGNRKDTTQFDMMKIVQLLNCHGFVLDYSLKHPGNSQVYWYNGKKRSNCYITTWIRP